MYIDNINDIETLRRLLKSKMIQLKEDIVTPTRFYHAGEWFFCDQDNEGINIWDDDPDSWWSFTYTEAAKFLGGK